jgi:hypothetical protein
MNWILENVCFSLLFYDWNCYWWWLKGRGEQEGWSRTAAEHYAVKMK